MIEGVLEDGKMVLRGADRTKNNVTRQVSGTWKAVPGGVQEGSPRANQGSAPLRGLYAIPRISGGVAAVRPDMLRA